MQTVFADWGHCRTNGSGVGLGVQPEFDHDLGVGELAMWVVSQNPFDIFAAEIASFHASVLLRVSRNWDGLSNPWEPQIFKLCQQ